MTHLRPITDQASVQLAPNPGPMTLDGTNSYVLRAGDGPAVVVDPGPEDAGHLAALAATHPTLILITHRHHDHTEGAETLHRLTGAPVRAPDPAFCHGGEPLVGGERITVGDLVIDVIATPGHTADSTCFHLPGDGPTGSVLTGDSVLGRGTTVIGIPDGTLGEYLESLRTLIGLGPCRVLPAHGPDLPDLTVICRQYLEHREERLDQVRAALGTLGVTAADAEVAAVADAVYGDVDPGVRFAAEHSVAAQLAYLRSAG
jgi:glyoxylase-like metal-dependent hydrolase (beta-lactamase superfamily II)